MKTILTREVVARFTEDEFIQLTLRTTDLSTNQIHNTVVRFENEVLPQLKKGPKERYDFYTNVLKIMKLAYSSDLDVTFWKDVAVKAKMEAEMHREQAAMYFDELYKYKAIQQAVDTNKLSQIIEAIETKRANDTSHNPK